MFKIYSNIAAMLRHMGLGVVYDRDSDNSISRFGGMVTALVTGVQRSKVESLGSGKRVLTLAKDAMVPDGNTVPLITFCSQSVGLQTFS